MKDTVSVNLKKVRLLGRFLIWIAVLPTLLAMVLLLGIAFMRFQFGDEISAAHQVAVQPPAENALPAKHLSLEKFHHTLLLSLGFSVLFTIFLFMIGRSWAKGKLFSKQVTFGLRCLGITMLVQTAVLFFAGRITTASTESTFHLINHFPHLLLSFVPLTAFGILILSMSWVIEDGRSLKEADELTI